MATCAVTGTVLTTKTRESHIVAGTGVTIILTLTGDTWVTAGATFDAQRFTASGLTTNDLLDRQRPAGAGASVGCFQAQDISQDTSSATHFDVLTIG
jgi:hypothetical protein